MKSKGIREFNRLCKQLDFFDSPINDLEVGELGKITVYKQKVNALAEKLEICYSELSSREQDESFEIFMKYQEYILKLSVELENKDCNSQHEKSTPVVANSSDSKEISVKLPKLEIPPFYGDIDQWISFKEIFSATILNNDKLTDLEKLQYLQTCVKGNALKLIKGFSLKSENLAHSWDILCDRFDCKRQLALTQIDKLFLLKFNKVNDAKSLLQISDSVNEAIRNLKTIGFESNALSDLMIVNLMLSKVDNSVKQRWELTLEDKQVIPNLEMFRAFIEKEARSLNQIPKGESKQVFGKKVGEYSGIKRVSCVNNSVTVKESKCVVCGQMHQLFKCKKFNEMNVNERWKIIKLNKLCANCFRGNHPVEKCRITIHCKNCSLPHHTLLHIYGTNPLNSTGENLAESVSHSVQCQPVGKSYNILLSTAQIKVKSPLGKIITCKALIDNASQNSLISQACARKLELPLSKTTHRLVGINGVLAETCLHSTEFKFSPYFTDDYKTLNALVVNRVTAPLPNFSFYKTQWPHIKDLQLADPEFAETDYIDVLLGADVFSDLISGPPILGKPGEPAAIPSTLGYLLGGKIFSPERKISTNSSVVCHSLNISEFYHNEAVPDMLHSPDINPAEELYSRTTRRNKDGRYVVKLPLKENFKLGDSASLALKTFYSLERRLTSNPTLKNEYSKFMHEYLDLGHMQLVSVEEIKQHPNYYLPHHPVINNNSETTKLRVVFNASAKTTNGESLNSVVHIGPKLQTSMFANLIKFRLYKVALTSDIEKMYRQILISDDQTALQQIFWRFSPNDPLLIYRLNTVTYGTACAPFLALRTIQQLCLDEKENFPVASTVASTHMYVDDFLGGAESTEEAIKLIQELTSFFKAGGFTLRKWASNDERAISGLPDSQKASSLKQSLNPDSSQRILGLEWNIHDDSLKVQVNKSGPVRTKRELLSIIAKIFDPLGILAPTTILLKIMLQDVWKSKLTWDEPLPASIQIKWDKFYGEINSFLSMSVPRYIFVSCDRIQLHGFCDASMKAYAAVIYLKSIHQENTVSLVAAKTRVAPLNQCTLPRLELNSALLLAELVTATLKALSCSISEVFLWTDSTIVLNWIENPPAKGNQYVLHRAKIIQKLTAECHWRHIPGKYNPADVATRGLYPQQLETCDSWWLGPSWLHHETHFPHSSNVPGSQNNICSSFQTMCLATQDDLDPNNNGIDNILAKFSSYSKLIRVLAWTQRFSYNCRNKPKITGPLTTQEMNNVVKIIVKAVQNNAYSTEIKNLQACKPLPKSSKLLPLNVFLDEDEILRVGGRLKQQNFLTFDKKHPMLIPKNHPVTATIIRYYHFYSLHAGPDLVLSLIRQKFWIPDGRSTVKRIIRQCFICRRISAKPLSQLMGDLPSSRITPCRAFLKVGVDFAGPISTKCMHKRRPTIFKSYICLFVCMCTKAVHLELVSDLSTEAFLLTLKRFISRRGLPSDVYSDNGKNFIGASAYLKGLFSLPKHPSIQNFCTERNISWHFSPPYGPHFGGLWESSVKLAKRHLVKICKGNLFNFEEISTLLCLIEATINSRPLVPLSTDPNDLNPLTPGHFLIGEPLLQLPNSNICTNQSLSFSSRWKSIRQAQSTFWTRWQREYLASLCQRRKWQSPQVLPKRGDLVLLKEPSCHLSKWKLARIEDVHPGKDQLIRVVTVRTPEGTLLRPISQIASLTDCSDAGPPQDGKQKTKIDSPNQPPRMRGGTEQ